MPVIPEPKIRKMKNDFINCNNSFYIIDQKLLEIVNVLKRSCQKLQIDFNQGPLDQNYQNKSHQHWDQKYLH